MSVKSAKAVLFMGPGKPLEQREFPIPEILEPGALLVKTRMATVCGSDVHTWKGRRPFPTPSILGHEIVGIIYEMGEGVNRDTSGQSVTIGDRITWTIMSSCGICFFCRVKGLPQKCLKLFKYGHAQSDRPPYFTGGFAEYVYLKPGTCFYKIPESMADEEAVPLMCAAATAAAGLDAIGVEMGDTVVIQGSGVLGLYIAALVKEQNVKQIIAVDIKEERLKIAREFGADLVLNLKELGSDKVMEEVKGTTGAIGADLIVEVSGDPAAVPLGIHMLRTGGRYLLQGAIYPNDRFTLDSHNVITKCLTL
ncbi:zinc-binding dehydrogenase, partial [bacterium]|nr:zinc-binding dehydrogenase [bacterium]